MRSHLVRAGRKVPRRGCDSRRAAQEVADEGGGGEHGAGRRLAHGDGIEKLAIRQRVQACGEVRPEEGKQNIAATEDNDAELQEHEEDRPEPRRERRGPRADARPFFSIEEGGEIAADLLRYLLLLQAMIEAHLAEVHEPLRIRLHFRRACRSPTTPGSRCAAG